MTASQDAAGPVRPRRIRGGDAGPPGATAWRRERRDPPQAALEEDVADRATGRLSVDADGIFAFAIFLPMLFIVQLTTLGGAMIAALVPIYLFVRRKQLLSVMIPRAFLFVVPALAVLSVVWSEAPRDTLRFAVELGLTAMAGILLSSAPNQEAVLRGMTLAFLVYVADALVTGGTVLIGVGGGGEALSGLTASKNLLGDIASTGLIISLAMVMMAIRSRKPLWVAIGAAAVALDLYSVAGARSAGAMLGLVMGLGALLALTPLLVAGKVVRAWLTSAVALALIVAGLSYRWIASTMIEVGANLFDKDPTLTGRTYLWYRAADLINEKPMLGRGYQAFWLQGNIDAEGLWRYFDIDARGGFTFHNTLVEILVTLGWIGAAVIIVTVLIGAIALIRRFIARPDLAQVFWISIFLYQLARTPIETIGIAPFYFSTALTFGALGAAFGRVSAPRPARAAHRAPQLVRAWTVDGAAAGWANPRAAPARGSLRILRPDAEAPQ